MVRPTLPVSDSEERIDQIELAIRCALHHPSLASSTAPALLDFHEPPPEKLFSTLLLDRLRNSIEALSLSGAQMGSTPEGYPWWASLIIRGVSRLLPWYTRSLQAYARAALETAAATAAILEDAERKAREAGR